MPRIVFLHAERLLWLDVTLLALQATAPPVLSVFRPWAILNSWSRLQWLTTLLRKAVGTVLVFCYFREYRWEQLSELLSPSPPPMLSVGQIQIIHNWENCRQSFNAEPDARIIRDQDASLRTNLSRRILTWCRRVGNQTTSTTVYLAVCFVLVLPCILWCLVEFSL